MDEMIIVKDKDIELTQEAVARIVSLETTLAVLKEKEEELKKAILEEMEAKKITKIDIDGLSVTYKASYDRESFDSKKFKADNPDLYDEYVRITQVRPSVILKVK
jgi:predicted phage-related endonuclease